MKIESSDVAMKSSYSYNKTEVKSETLEFWKGNIRVKIENGSASDIREKFREAKRDRLNISESAKLAFEELNSDEDIKSIEEAEKSDPFEMSEKDKQKLEILKRLLEVLTGKKIDYKEPEIDKKELKNLKETEKKISEIQNNSENSEGIKRAGWGLIYKKSEITKEREVVGFKSEGVVKTSDGREIAFKINFNLKRESEYGKSIEIKMGDALVDPLVINFNGNISQLTSDKIEFDIDADGVKDFISFAGVGSGFLAFDKNENGEIDDGSELFGPQIGNGFTELKEYDYDGNNWIDENDEVFSKLKVWTMGENGEKKLLSIAEAGVGAIYLENSATKFNMVNETGSLDGIMKRSGIFLKESGEAGIIQHIDLKK